MQYYEIRIYHEIYNIANVKKGILTFCLYLKSSVLPGGTNGCLGGEGGARKRVEGRGGAGMRTAIVPH